MTTVDELDAAARPADRVTADRLRRYIAYMAQRVAPSTQQGRLIGLYGVVQLLQPGADVALVRRVVRRMGDRMIGRRRDAPSSAVLLRLGLDLMAKAEAEDGGLYPNRRAGRYRDGLMIALLAHRPLRRRNFASLQIGRHVVREPSGWHIRVPASETKTRRALDYDIPTALQGHLDRYLARYRPVLAAVAEDPLPVDAGPLWLSARTGRAMSAHGMNLRIAELTHLHLGARVNLHRFRHAAATTMAIEDPEHVGVAMAVNGHADPATMQTHYNLAGQQSATLRHHDVLAMAREAAQARRRRHRRPNTAVPAAPVAPSAKIDPIPPRRT